MTETEVTFWIWLVWAAFYFVGCLWNLKKLLDTQKLNKEADETLDAVKKIHAKAIETLANIGRRYVPIVHAHWVWSGNLEEDEEKMFICSHCGECAHYDGVTWHTDPFCWNCGARMGEEVKHNEHE